MLGLFNQCLGNNWRHESWLHHCGSLAESSLVGAAGLAAAEGGAWDVEKEQLEGGNPYISLLGFCLVAIWRPTVGLTVDVAIFQEFCLSKKIQATWHWRNPLSPLQVKQPDSAVAEWIGSLPKEFPDFWLYLATLSDPVVSWNASMLRRSRWTGAKTWRPWSILPCCGSDCGLVGVSWDFSNYKSKPRSKTWCAAHDAFKDWQAAEGNFCCFSWSFEGILILLQWGQVIFLVIIVNFCFWTARRSPFYFQAEFRWAVQVVRSRAFTGPYEGRGPQDRAAQLAFISVLLVLSVGSGFVSLENGLNGALAAALAIPLTDPWLSLSFRGFPDLPVASWSFVEVLKLPEAIAMHNVRIDGVVNQQLGCPVAKLSPIDYNMCLPCCNWGLLGWTEPGKHCENAMTRGCPLGIGSNSVGDFFDLRSSTLKRHVLCPVVDYLNHVPCLSKMYGEFPVTWYSLFGGYIVYSSKQDTVNACVIPTPACFSETAGWTFENAWDKPCLKSSEMKFHSFDPFRTAQPSLTLPTSILPMSLQFAWMGASRTVQLWRCLVEDYECHSTWQYDIKRE